MFLEDNFDSDEDTTNNNQGNQINNNVTNDPFSYQNTNHNLISNQSNINSNNHNYNNNNFKDLNDIKNQNNNGINTSNFIKKNNNNMSGIIELDNKQSNLSNNNNDLIMSNNNYDDSRLGNENLITNDNEIQQSGKNRRANRKQTNNKNHSKIQERYEQRAKELYQDGQSQKQQKFQATSSNYYEGINFNNVIDGQNNQYEPGQLKGIDSDLPTLTQQNKQFQVQEENKRSHLKLSDDSDHDFSDKEQEIKNKEEDKVKQESNNQIQFSDDSDDDSEVVTKQMEELKLEQQNDQDDEKGAAQVQIEEKQDQQKQNDDQMTPADKKTDDNAQEDDEEEETKNKKIIAKPIDDFEIPDMKEFLTKPLPKGLLLQCTIKRDKSKLSHFYPKYHVFLSKKFQHIMSGKKRSGCKTSNYLISMDKNKIDKKSPGFLGKVRSNFMGTEFHVYDTGLNPKDTKQLEKVRKELACVLYESNILGAKGPRKMKTLVPDIDETTGEPIEWQPLNNNDSMLTKFRADNKNGMQYYFNKPPKWNEHIQAFVLNFNGRVDKASVKNFQLIDEYDDDAILLQFGRVGNDLFSMDLQYPLSPLQAFGICLSSFDYKIACE